MREVGVPGLFFFLPDISYSYRCRSYKMVMLVLRM